MLKIVPVFVVQKEPNINPEHAKVLLFRCLDELRASDNRNARSENNEQKESQAA